jgi:putative transcriptional regulator
MTKAGERLIAGMREAVEIMQGRADPATYKVHTPATVDVRAIRSKLKLSQAKFAMRYGFPLPTLQKWEQGARHPTGSARVLLMVIDRNPEAVEAALEAA